MPANVPASAHHRIGRLAQATAVHRAFHWLHLHQPQLRAWQMEMLAIPAPPFGEAARAAWFLERFDGLGLTNVKLDGAGNALAELPSGSPPDSPCVLLSAHLDTVFPAELFTADRPYTLSEDDARILCPGACDNAAGLTALLAIAAALRYAQVTPPVTILFAANVGEEGEGDLRGMRHLFLHGAYRDRIAAAIALEGSGNVPVVTRALASRRLRLTVSGPGGHSWTDAGTPNPIATLSRILAAMDEVELPDEPRTTFNIGLISGGTSVNSIPEAASALLDLRSTDSEQLAATEVEMRAIIARFEQELAPAGRVRLSIDTIGDRPGGALPEDAALLHTVRAVDRHLTLRTEQRLGSTDANIPLSLGVPAIAIGCGGTASGIHTLQEWYDPTGRETALRRILLTLLDTVSQAAEASTEAMASD
jgi:acetylornithine deacetylase/succinyl-diaminopimelate desuccinylase-like protein